MKLSRRILALLLCTILTVNPWMAVLSEEALVAVEPAVELEPEVAFEPEPDDAPGNPAPEAGGDALPPEDSGDGSDEPAPEPEADADASEPSPSDPPLEELMEEVLPAEEGEALPAEGEVMDGEGDAPELIVDGEGDAPELLATAPDGVELIVPEEAIELGAGEKRSIGASFSDGNSYPIEYESDAPAVATVSGDGTVTAVAAGEAHIALNSECGAASVTVTVREAPKAITVTAGRTTLGAKSGAYVDSVQLHVELEPANAMSELTYSSNKKSVATVDASGKVTAVNAGTATITVKAAANGVKKTITITVKKAPGSISIKSVKLVNEAGAEPVSTAIKNGALTIGVDQPATLAAALSSGSAGPYSFRVEPEGAEVLDVDPDTGELHAKAPGTATVVAETYNHKSARCEVTVKARPTEITLSQPDAAPAEGNWIEATLGVGGTLALPSVALRADGSEDCQDSCVLASRDAKLAAIDAKNKRITAKAAGDVDIVATNYSGLTATLRLHIQLKPTKVAILSAPRKTLGAEYKLDDGTPVYDTVQIEAAVTKPEAGAYPKLTYSSSKKSVATVDEATGLVTAHAAGTATITAKSYSGAKASVTITVKKAPTGVTLSEHALTLAAGDTEKVKLTAKLSSGSAGPYSFRVEPEDAGAFDFDEETGEITPLAPGEAKIVVETYNGKADECEVTVLPEVASLELSSYSATLGVDEKLDLPAVTRLDANGEETVGSYEFVADPEYVKISNGQIIARRVTEETTVTAVAYNDAQVDFKLSIQPKPTGVKLTAPRTTLGAKYTDENGEEFTDTVQLSWTLSPATAASALRFSSSNKSIATVDEAGLVTALKAGKATITLQTYNGKKSSVTITVKKAPTGVTLSEHALTLAAGDTEKVKLTAKLSSGSAGPYSFRVEPEDAGAFDFDEETGEITPLAPGKAKIVVETYNGKTDACEVTVLPEVASLELSSYSATLGVDEKLDLPAVTRLDANGEETVGSYEFVADPEYVKISNGQIVARRVTEETTVTAVAYNDAQVDFKLSIQPKPTGVKLTAPRTTLGAKYTDENGGEFTDTVQLSWTLSPATAASALRFSSSNKSVATVDENGKVTALKAGKATITLQTYNGKKSSVTITVKKAPTSVTLSEHPEAFGVGETFQFTAKLTDKSAGRYWFSSDDESVAEIDPGTGMLTAKSVGTANIAVETYNGKSDSRAIEVKPAPDRLELSVVEATLGVNETMDAPIVTNRTADGGEAAGSYSCKPDNAKYVQILSNGRIKALRTISETSVVFTSYKEGVRAELLLHIVAAPTGVSLSADHTTLGVDEEIALAPTLKPATAASKLTYTSSKEAVATVNEDGVVTAVAPGTAKITVSTYNGKKASVTFTVLEKPTDVALPASLTLGLGEKYAIAPVLTPAGSGGGITYTTNDPGVATVERVTDSKTKAISYQIVAQGTGCTTLRAEMYSGCWDICVLTVKNAPEGIQFNDENFTLSVGDTRQLNPPTLLGENVASGAITYKSSNGNVKVSATGLVTAAKTGSADITVSTYNGKKSGKLRVTVKAAVSSISFVETEQHRLFIGHSFVPAVKFNNGVASSYTLESSDPSVACIGDDGRTVCATDKPGTATITATSYNKKVTKKPLTVWVPALPTEVKLSPAALTLGAGDSATLRLQVPEGQGAEMDYASLAKDIAGVEVIDNETITVRALRAGEADIRAHSQNDKEAISKLTVLKAPTALSLSPSRAGRCIDERTLQLRVGFGSDGEGGRVEFSSSNESIATVDDNGLVTFVKTGEVRITAKSYNDHVAVCALTIGVAPGRMEFEQEKYTVALGDTVQLPVRFDKGCESYALSAGDGGILSASGDTVTALQLGTTTVTAVNRRGNLTARCEVTVVEAPTGLELAVIDEATQQEAPADSIKLVAYTAEGIQLIAKPLPGGVGSVHFSSSAPGIATVDYATGFVTPIASGDCVIRATTFNGITATCDVHVSLPLEGVKVGIDPGHQAHGNSGRESVSPKGGGSKVKCASSSAGVARVQEHVIDLQVGLKLRDALVRLGAEVVMTRETANVDISNQQRAFLMNREHVDLSLRIHCDSWDGSAHGYTIFRRASCAYKDKDVDPKQGSGKTLMANEKKLANSINKYFKAETGAYSRGVKTSDEYTMNNWAKVPCLLVELGFMTDPTEGRNLVKPAYQDKMVRGLVKGICGYVGAPIPTIW